jgi:hypothetical protein
MLNPAFFLAPIALLLPLTAANAPSELARLGLAPEAVEQEAVGFESEEEAPYKVFLDAAQPAEQRQVRIEQRVVVRISPRSQSGRQDLLAELPRGEVPNRLEERRMGNCLPIQRIAGVQTSNDNRLILFLSDRRIVAATLDRTCTAEDFYSGFYVERNDDGLLCVNRDELQSRSGAKCGLGAFHQLVPVSN